VQSADAVIVDIVAKCVTVAINITINMIVADVIRVA